MTENAYPYLTDPHPAAAIPPGYRANSAGHLVPEEQVSELDKVKDSLVKELVSRAKRVQELLKGFKHGATADVEAFVQLAAEQYNAKIGGTKGNIQLLSFDGRHKVEINVADQMIFDEKMHAAKALIDQCIHKWSAGSRSEIKALVEHAFQTDKRGRINYSRIVTLMRLSIDDPNWQNAMQALKDSHQVVGSKAYIRLYERTAPDQPYSQIALDMAAL
ncbi:DUF3164 family protein [Methylocaldum sp.]|uniref:DUF3164 family protein n=1 Tax=Methylocaldum sp. TaxID=1969727 RepID=UPI002D5A445A|nr:DUF3164 family protein [Methylocaldum sp.]HYE35480.1 DUF3164 family protein [Methylocaldum sp.]